MFDKAGIYVLALLCLTPTACNKGGKGAQGADRAAETSGQLTQRDSMKLTIEAIDQSAGMVRVRDEQGSVYPMQVGDPATLARLRPNDQIDVRYEATVAFALAEKGREPAEPLVESSARELPKGVQFGRRIEAAVQVVSVDQEGKSATIRAPAGELRTVLIEDEKSRQKVSQLRPGDVVDVSYTEKLAVEVATQQQL